MDRLEAWNRRAFEFFRAHQAHFIAAFAALVVSVFLTWPFAPAMVFLALLILLACFCQLKLDYSRLSSTSVDLLALMRCGREPQWQQKSLLRRW